MKIQAIKNYNSINKEMYKSNYIDSSMKDLSTNKTNFVLNFGSGHWRLKKINILGRGASEMVDLAEYFHSMPKGNILDVSRIENFLGFKKSEESSIAFKKLSEAINKVNNGKLIKVKRIAELEPKIALGISNLTEQKTRLNREFISLIAAEKEGKNPPIDNGILVHGTSKEKDNFINWLTESAGAVVKTIQHDSNKPTKTIDTLIDIAENAERAFKHSRTRTVVVVKDLEKMLTNKNSADAMDNINEFKSIAEDLSQRYHTTIITKTDKPLDVFEPATIASNRLGVHVNLKDGISEEELKELNSLKAEVKRLDDKAKSVWDTFWQHESSGPGWSGNVPRG